MDGSRARTAPEFAFYERSERFASRSRPAFGGNIVRGPIARKKSRSSPDARDRLAPMASFTLDFP